MSDPEREPKAPAAAAPDAAELPDTELDMFLDDEDTIDAEEEDALRRFISFLRFVEEESGSLDVDLSQPSHFNVEAEFYADVHGQSPGRLRGLRGGGRPRRFRRSEAKPPAAETESMEADEGEVADAGEEDLPEGRWTKLLESWRQRPRLLLLAVGGVALCIIIVILLIWLL
ncbi:MAG: hypothetical protein QM296_07395 [Bacillota bacterium]|nr:hypothetical protein [Bacillota bacterium]